MFSTLIIDFRFDYTGGMENPENVLMTLSAFEKEPAECIPESLEEYLSYVAKTGNSVFPWTKVKPLLRRKLEKIILEFSESCPADSLPKQPNVEGFRFGEMRERILEQLEGYTGTPFTMQRLCELVTQPRRHYKRTDKVVVTHIDVGSPHPTHTFQLNG